MTTEAGSQARLSVHAAFAATAAGGNVAGVVLSDHELSTEQMRRSAQQLALPTVAFAVAGERGDVSTRMFTSTGEIAACGHASAAVAAELYRTDNGEPDRIVIRSPGGAIPFAVSGPPELPEVSMTVPVGRWSVEAAPEGLSRLLAAPLDAAVPVGRVETGLTHLIVALSGRDDLNRLSLDHERWRSFGHEVGVDTIGLVAVGPDGRIELRDICAPIGDTEEAASGTTATAVSWHLFQLGLGSAFDVRQGVAMGRPSRLQTSIAGGGVTIRGRVRRITSGTLAGPSMSAGADGSTR